MFKFDNTVNYRTIKLINVNKKKKKKKRSEEGRVGKKNINT